MAPNIYRLRALQIARQAQLKGATRTQIRAVLRRHKQTVKKNKKRKEHRFRILAKRAVAKEAGLRKPRKARTVQVRGGTWNTRGWGAKYARIEQYLKTECKHT